MQRFVLLIFLFLNLCSYSQTKSVKFFGVNTIQYEQPVKAPDGKYKAYHKNLGDEREQGTIIVNETNKTFTINYKSGDTWVGKYSKFFSSKVYDQLLGDVVKTTYLGNWEDDKSDCELIITTTKQAECVFTVNSKKVFDSAHGINTWQKTFRFFNMNKCLQGD